MKTIILSLILALSACAAKHDQTKDCAHIPVWSDKPVSLTGGMDWDQVMVLHVPTMTCLPIDGLVVSDISGTDTAGGHVFALIYDGVNYPVSFNGSYEEARLFRDTLVTSLSAL